MTRESNGDATAARRAEVVRRLLERGMPVRALEALLPGWEATIAEVAAAGRSRPPDLSAGSSQGEVVFGA